MIDITAFSQEGKAYGLKKFPSILVLGQDFSTVDCYNKMLRNELTDLECSTWRNLIKLFRESDVDLKEFFFSNVFMGLENLLKIICFIEFSNQLEYNGTRVMAFCKLL